MIIDVFTHIWQSRKQLGRLVDSSAPWEGPDATEILAHFEPRDGAVVLAFQSRMLDAEVPNRYVSEFVSAHADRLVGFACVDPTAKGAVRELEKAQSNLGLKGLALSPGSQGFHPSHTRAFALYEAAEHLKMPVIFHSGPIPCRHAQMEYDRPVLLDNVSRSFPDLKIFIARMGAPWVDETLMLLRKHPNVYAIVGGLLRQRWAAYQGLVAAYQLGLTPRLLFGSDYPNATASQAIETLYSLNEMTRTGGLPPIKREQMRGIVERSSLELLGVDWTPQVKSKENNQIEDKETSNQEVESHG